MTLAEMVVMLGEKSQLSKASAVKALIMITAAIEEEVKKGGKVTIRGFGTFLAAERKARKVRNPRTGKEIMIAAKKVPKFSAGEALKAAAADTAVRTKPKAEERD